MEFDGLAVDIKIDITWKEPCTNPQEKEQREIALAHAKLKAAQVSSQLREHLEQSIHNDSWPGNEPYLSWHS